MERVDTLQMAFMIKDRLDELDMNDLFAYIQSKISEDKIINYKVKNKYIKVETSVTIGNMTETVQKYIKKNIQKKYVDDSDNTNKSDRKKLINTICDDALDVFVEISDEDNGIIIIEKV